jgi:hypothetical protein
MILCYTWRLSGSPVLTPGDLAWGTRVEPRLRSLVFMSNNFGIQFYLVIGENTLLVFFSRRLFGHLETTVLSNEMQ